MVSYCNQAKIVIKETVKLALVKHSFADETLAAKYFL